MAQELKNSITANRDTDRVAARNQLMKETLRQAEKIRRSLEGRKHSDSTKLIAEDRQR